ncbi:MAG: Sec-independent protein translocase subunit TatA [Burkholderiaceae bacterium]
MGISTTHLIIFLVIIVLIFGTRKLKNIGTDLGAAVKGFKDGMKDGEAAKSPEQDVAHPAQQVSGPAADKRPAGETIDVEATRR